MNPMKFIVKVKAADGYTYYMAEALLDTVLGKTGGGRKTGIRSAGKPIRAKIWNTRRMSRCLTVQWISVKNRIRKPTIVTCDTYVTLSDGTGVVHIAPAFGEDDEQT